MTLRFQASTSKKAFCKILPKVKSLSRPKAKNRQKRAIFTTMGLFPWDETEWAYNRK